jgi:tetratricopeptide (TPR) repeat protein
VLALPLLGVLALRHAVLGEWVRAALPPLENNPLAHAPALAGRLEALRLGARGAALFLWPFPLRGDYGFAATDVPPVDPLSLLSVGAGVGAALLLLGLACRRPVTAAGAVLFVTGQILTSNVIFPIGTAFAERLLYLPMAGLCLAAADLAWAGVSWTGLRLARGAAIAAGCVLLAACALATAQREGDYADDLRYWRSAAAASPASARARYNFGRSLAARGEHGAARGEYEAAVQIYERAPVPTPGHPLALNNLGATLLRLGRSDTALRHLERAAALAPGSAEVAMNLALALHAEGRGADARASFARGAALDPALGERLRREGGIWTTLASGAPGVLAPPPDLSPPGSPPPP